MSVIGLSSRLALNMAGSIARLTPARGSRGGRGHPGLRATALGVNCNPKRSRSLSGAAARAAESARCCGAKVASEPECASVCRKVNIHSMFYLMKAAH